jgi:murein DD-endopeptidase MepM/ murein hydrolase activator NlpD
VKNKLNEMLRDKLFLVVLVLGLLTIVAAAGVMTMKRGDEQNPYMNMEEGNLLAQEQAGLSDGATAGESDARRAEDANEERQLVSNAGNPDTAVTEGNYGADGEQLAMADGGSSDPAAGGVGAAGKVGIAGEDGLSAADGSEIAGGSDSSAQAVDSGLNAATALVLNFTDTDRMTWPVRGNVLLDYSMDTTIYFPTLDQYKCNPAIVIQGEVSEPVYAPANARVLESGVNEEIGNYLRLDFGNDYTAICGQLKDLAVSEGEYLEKGQLLGYVAEPTKYYTIEGSNVFFEVHHGDAIVDPLDYLE